MRNELQASIDRFLSATRIPGSPNAILAVELREWVLEYLREIDEDSPRCPAGPTEPHWNLWMVDGDWDTALFVVTAFWPTHIELVCGTGDSLSIRSWDSDDPNNNPRHISTELRKAFRVPEESLVIPQEAGEAWLGRGWCGNTA